MEDSEGAAVMPQPINTIKDSGAAQELAYLEKPARDREAELKRQEQTGLTKEQEGNVAILEGLQEKYPKAFNEIIDDKGRKVLTLDVWGNPVRRLGTSKLLISQEGIIGMGSSNFHPQDQEINFAGVVDAVAEKGSEFGRRHGGWESFEPSQVLMSGSIRKEIVEKGEKVGVRKIDLLSAGEREDLKTAFVQSQENNISREQERKKKEESMNPQKILADL